MKNSVNLIYIALVSFTFLVAGISSFFSVKQATIFVIILSVTKFILVGFEFMELKFAHGFWKFLLLFYCLVIGSVFAFLLG